MKAIFVLLLLAGPAWADSPPPLSHDELCVWRAAILIDPQIPQETADKVAAEIAKRRESCNDPIYMQAAEARLTNAQRQADAQAQQASQQELASQQQAAYQQAQAAQQQQAQADEDERRREDRASRVRAAAEAVLQMQQQQRDRAWSNQPKHTSCRQTMFGMDCTTN